MHTTWKDGIHHQREELMRILHKPMQELARQHTHRWCHKSQIEAILMQFFASIPYCTRLYVLDNNGVQVCDSIDHMAVRPGHYGRDHSQQLYMKETVPTWDFYLSDAYINPSDQRPCLTALQGIRSNNRIIGYLGADFMLRDLPVNAELYHEPENWRQVKGDPAIRHLLFQQTRVESPMDRNMDQALVILEEMLTQRGVFQTQIHFSRSQATIWMKNDPFRYRILDIDALTDPDICLVYSSQPYPAEATIPPDKITSILETFKKLRMADENIYLRQASINLYNGMVSVTFSCDGSHYMPYDEFLRKNTKFWLGAAA